MSKRSDAKQEVATIQNICKDYIGKEMQMSFDIHSFPIIITDIRLARLSDVPNKPDTRLGEEKNYRPPMMILETDVGILYFVIEDIEIVGITNGIQIDTNAVSIQIKGIQ